jgi:hypothetical protein
VGDDEIEDAGEREVSERGSGEGVVGDAGGSTARVFSEETVRSARSWASRRVALGDTGAAGRRSRPLALGATRP